VRKFFFKLHLWASITLSPLILVFAITGCFMAFEPELDHLLHANLSYVEPAGKTLSLAAINDIVHKSYPNDTITTYNLSASADISYQVYTNNRAIYIDQYSGKLLGTMTKQDFWNKTQQNIHQLHLRLAFYDKHDTGKSIMSWVGVAMLFILPSGLILWWKQKRFSIRAGSKSRQFWFDFHSMIGVVAFLFILVPTVTGVVIGFENTTGPLLYKITGSKPSERPDFKITAEITKKQILPDSALRITMNALPGVTPFNINVPGPTDAYMIRCRYPEDLTPGGRSMVILDPYSGKVLFAEGSRTAPAGTRLKNLNRAIHTGDIFGLSSKFFGLLVCLALIAQITSGLRMWWLRKFKKTTPKSD
jgi:uncharacterized iron-regulated membrane protein